MVQRQRLHPNGPTLSRLVWGAWRARDAEVLATPQGLVRMLETCLEHGITTIDHADIYGDYAVEALFGEAMRLAPGLKDRLEIVTKCDIALVSPARPSHRVKHYDTGAAHIRASVERSLREVDKTPLRVERHGVDAAVEEIDETVVPMAHRDTDGDEAYTFVQSEGAADTPYVAGSAVVDTAQVTYTGSMDEGMDDETEMADTETEMADSEMDEDTDTTSTETPGFGVVVALVALLAAALLAVRRD